MPQHERDEWIEHFRRVRGATEALAAPLSAEDQLLQPMPDASPTKWHRAHTTWFFETFVLAPHGVPAFDPRYSYLFNSYYEKVGARHPRPRRGMLSRPSADEVTDYRRRVDGRVIELCAALGDGPFEKLVPTLALGLAHEEQHQELILTDIQNAFSASPLLPVYRTPAVAPARAALPLAFVSFDGGLHEIGVDPGEGFAFDNEGPRHKVWLEPFAISSRLVTLARARRLRARGWLPNAILVALGRLGLRARQRHRGAALCALRWRDLRSVRARRGARAPADDEPVCHVSYYEADAIARFLGARLPTEAEWEVASRRASQPGAWADAAALRPEPARGEGLAQMFGDVWEWTASAYEPYPGYRAASGAHRRVQRQVHGRPAGAARRLVLHAARPRSPELPQLLAGGHTLSDDGDSLGARRKAVR